MQPRTPTPADYAAPVLPFRCEAPCGRVRRIPVDLAAGRLAGRPAPRFAAALLALATGPALAQDAASASNSPEPYLGLDSPHVTEGDSGYSTLTFTARLTDANGRTQAGTEQITAGYSVLSESGDTATAGIDYEATSGTLTFQPGETSRTIEVTVHGDAEVEGDETLTLRWTKWSNVLLVSYTHTGTIVNDDEEAPPEVVLSIDPARVGEGAVAAEVTVRAEFRGGRTYAGDWTVRVSVGSVNDSAVEGADYEAVPDFNLPIPSGQIKATGSFTLRPTNDRLREGDETISISGTDGGPKAGVIGAGMTVTGASLTLVDNDPDPVDEPEDPVDDPQEPEDPTKKPPEDEEVPPNKGDWTQIPTAAAQAWDAAGAAQASAWAQASSGSAWQWTTSAGPLKCSADSDRIVEGTELWIKCEPTKTMYGATVDFNVVWTQLGSHGTGYRFNTWRLTFVEGSKAGHQQAVKIFIPDDGLPENSGKVLKIWAKMSFKFGTKSIFGIPIWVTTNEATFYKTLHVDDDDGEFVVSADRDSVDEGTAHSLELSARLTSGDSPPSGFKVDVEVGASGDTATEGTDYTTIPKQTLTFGGSSAEASTSVTLHPQTDGLEGDETISVTGTVVGDSASHVRTVRGDSILIPEKGRRDLTLKLSVPADSKQSTPATSIEVCENGGVRNAKSVCDGGDAVSVRATVEAASTYNRERRILLKVGGAHGDTALGGTHYDNVADFEVTIAANQTSGTADFSFKLRDNQHQGEATHLTVHGQETGTHSMSGPVSSARIAIADNDGNIHMYDLPRAPIEIVEGDSGTSKSFDVSMEFDSNSTDGNNQGLACAVKFNYSFTTGYHYWPALSNPATPTTDNSTTPGDFLGGKSKTWPGNIAEGTTVASDALSGTIYGDNIVEGDEQFYASTSHLLCENLSKTGPNPKYSDSEYRLIVIKDDDSGEISLSASVHELVEDKGKQSVTVTAATTHNTVFATDQIIKVAVGNVGDTATEGTDYKTVADLDITIKAGQTSGTATFDFEPIDDAQTEREFISLKGSSTTLPASTPIYHTDIDLGDWDWPMALKVKPTTVTEAGGKNGPTQTVTVEAVGPSVRPLRQIRVDVSVGKTGDTAESGTDYTAVRDFSFTIDPQNVSNPDQTTFDIEIIDDSVDEGDDATAFEKITLSATASLPNLSEADASAISENELSVDGTELGIKDNDTADFEISVSPASVDEGTEPGNKDSKSHTMTVTLSAKTAFAEAKTVNVGVGLNADSATSGTDYTAVPNFDIDVAAGANTATGTFTFTPTDDTDYEGTETVTVHGTATGLDIAAGTFDIADDDYPVVELAFTPDEVRENDTQPTVTLGAKWDGDYTWHQDVNITVSIGEDTDTAVDGASCTAGVDYKSVSDLTLTIPSGSKGQTNSFIFYPCDDSLDEGSEHLTASGSGTGVRFSSKTPKLTIKDDDRLSIDISMDPINFKEDSGDTTVTVTMTAEGLGSTGASASASTGREIELDLVLGKSGDTAVSGTDYSAVTFSKVTFKQDETQTATFTFSPTDDSTIEGTEKFTLVGTATVKTGTANAQSFGGAGAAGRFSAVGSSSVDVDNPEGQLRDDDLPAPGLSLSPATVSEDGGAKTVTVTLTDPKTSTEDIDYTISISSGSSATSGTDFAAVGDFTLTIDEGNTTGTATFDLTPIDDTLVEGEERIIVEIDHATLVANAQLALTDDDDGAMTLSVKPSSVAEEASATLVTVTAATDGDTFSDDQTITVVVGESGDTAVEGTDYATVADFTVKIAAGDTSASGAFSFAPVDDDVAGATLQATVSGTASGGYTVSDVSVDLTDNDTVGATLTPASLTVNETAGSRAGTYTVELDSEPTGEVTVTLASGDATVATVSPASLTFTSSDWDSAQTVTVTAVDDDIDNDPDRSTNISHTFAGADYAGLEAVSLSVTVTDDDTAGLTLGVGVDTSVTVDEDGGTGTYTVVLDSEPTGEVTVTPDSSDVSVATVSGALTFTTSNWDTAQTVTVTGVNDDIDNATDRTTTVTHTFAGGGYDDVTSGAVSVTATDDDTRGVTVSSIVVSVDENGGTGTYTVVLDTEPTGSVTVTPASGNTAVATVSAAITFTASDWSTPKTVTVTGVDDYIDNATNRTATISHTVSGADYAGVSAVDVTATATDDDTRGVTISSTAVSTGENGGTGTYTVVLDTEPTGSVTVTPASGDTDVATVSGALTFTAADWSTPKTVTVTGVDDDIDNASNRTATISHTVAGADYASVTAADVTATATDDDGKGVTVSSASVTAGEDGGTATYTVVLDTEPTGSVTVTPASGDSAVATVSGALTFTTSNWSSPQTVTVTGVDDDIDNATNRTATISHTVSGADYAGVSAASVTAAATDDDTRGVTVSKTTVSADEDGGTDTYTVVLDSEPTGSVTVTPASGDTSVVTVSTALTFTASNWSTPKTVTVTGVDDDIDNATNRTATVSHTVSGADYASVTAANVTATASNDDTRGVTVSSTAVSADEDGGTATYTVVLDTEPTGNVTVTPSSGDTGVATVSGALTFTASDWSTPKTVTVTGVNDDIDNVTNRTTKVSHTVSGADYADAAAAVVTATTTDDDTRGVAVSPASASASENGGTTDYSVVLESEPTGSVTVTPSSSDIDIATVSAALTFTASDWSTPQTVTVTGVNDDIDNESNRTARITFKPSGADYVGVADAAADFTAVDDEKAAVIVSRTSVTTAEDGGKAAWTVALASEPTDSVTVTPSSGDTSVATVSGSLTFTATDWANPQTVTVTGIDDDIDNDPERTATISHAVAGGGYDSVTADDVSVTATDDDTRGVAVTPASASAPEDGGTASYSVVLDSEPTGSVTVTPVSGDTSVATVSNALTFTASNWETPQSVTVTGVNDDVDNDAGRIVAIMFQPSGADYANAPDASVDFTATNDDIRGFSVSPASASASEYGGTAAYSVVLESEPTGTVTVTPASGDTLVARVSGPVRFNAADWSTPKTVTVTGVDDDIDNSSNRTAQLSFRPSGADYSAVGDAAASFTAVDDESAGVIVSPTSVTVSEDRGTAVYTVELASEPTGSVTVTPSSGDASVATVSGPLTFSPWDWSSPKTVTVTGVDDDIDNSGYRTTRIVHTVAGADYGGVQAEDVAVTVSDDETRGVTISPLILSATENGGTAAYTVVLDSQPDGEVTVMPASADVSVATVSGTLTFGPANWRSPQSLTVTAVNDDLVNEPDRSTLISNAVVGGGYGGVEAADVAFTALDDDARGIVVDPTRLSAPENGGTATYTVTLRSEPAGTVTVTPASADASVAAVSGPLTFTPGDWATPQTVTVTSDDDDLVNDPDRSVTVAHTVSGGSYDGVNAASVEFTALDDDVADIGTDDARGVTVDPLSLSAPEDGGIATYTVALDSQPEGTVTVTPTSADTSVATVSAPLTFTASDWSTPQTVTVTAVDDDLVNGELADDALPGQSGRTVAISHTVAGGGYDGVEAASVEFTALDDDESPAAQNPDPGADDAPTVSRRERVLLPEALRAMRSSTTQAVESRMHRRLDRNGLNRSAAAADDGDAPPDGHAAEGGDGAHDGHTAGGNGAPGDDAATLVAGWMVEAFGRTPCDNPTPGAPLLFDLPGEGRECPQQPSGVDRRNFWPTGRTFEYSLAGLGLWATADRQTLSGPDGSSMGWNGEMTGLHAGLDRMFGDRALLGLAVSRHATEFGYRHTDGPRPFYGTQISDSQSFHPYAALRLSGGGRLWASAGRGTGAWSDLDEEEGRYDSRQRWSSVAAGGGLPIMRGKTTLEAVFDASASRLELDDPDNLLADTAVATARARGSLDVSRAVSFDGGSALQMRGRLGVLNEAGDGETGTAVEAGLGTAWSMASGGLSLGFDWSALLSHRGGVDRESLSAWIEREPTNSQGTGWRFRFAPSLGTADAGIAQAGGPLTAARLLDPRELEMLAAGRDPSAPRLDAQIGYGFPRHGLAPYVGISADGENRSRTWTGGLVWTTPGAVIWKFDVERTESQGAPPNHRFMLRIDSPR